LSGSEKRERDEGRLLTMRWRKCSTLAAAFIVAALAFASAVSGPATVLAQEAAQISIRAPEEKVKNDVDEFIVPVEIAGAENLGAFLFYLTYDSQVVAVKDVRPGPFLGSSGREVSCDPPVLQDGEVRYFCVTLRPAPAGADGGGVLAEVVFEPKDGGTTQLEITRAQITDPAGVVLDHTTTAATLEVAEGSSFAIWWLILIGVAGGVIVLVVFEVVRRWMKSRRAPAEAA
jgi:cohesin domain-containing protein